MGKSSSAPPAPDYQGAAEATAQGNLDAAKYAANANRVDQITPYGNLTYTQNNDGTFDQAGYDTAMADYQSQLNAYNNPTGGHGLYGRLASTLNRGAAPTAPDRAKFTTDPRWTATQNLSPAEQAQLESNQALQLQLSHLAQTGANSAEGILSNPTVDYSGLPTPISGQSAQDEIMKRLQPQLDRQREALRTQLANQGLTMPSTMDSSGTPNGGEAYRSAFFDQGQHENDLMSAAAVQGIGIDQQARQQGIQERAYQQDRPLNLINALRTGSQVQSPNFINVGQQGQTAGPDYMGATNALSGYNTDLFNQDQAQRNNNVSTAGTVAAAAITVY